MNDWFNAERDAERAHHYFEAGEWQKAFHALRKAIDVNPHQSEWHFGMGLTLRELDRHEEALESFQNAIDLSHDDVNAHLHLAVTLLYLEQFEEAAKRLKVLQSIDSTFEPGFCHAIRAYGHLDDFDKAEEMFYMARQLVDECPQCYDHMAEAMMMQHKTEKAIWCWQQVLKLDPAHEHVNANLAIAHLEFGQYSRARDYFLQQIRDYPNDIETLLQFGMMLVETGYYNDGREKFKRVLEIDPTNAEAHRHLGELSLMAGHLDSAQAELEMALRLDPNLPGANLGLAQISQQRGQLSMARKLLELEVSCDNHDPQQLLDTARMLIDLRRPKYVMELVEPIIESKGGAALDAATRSEARLLRGAAHLLLGNYEAGMADCKAVVKEVPDNTLAMHNLALAHYEQHNYLRAGYWVRKALSLDPNDVGLRQLRGRIFWGRFRKRLARFTGR